MIHESEEGLKIVGAFSMSHSTVRDFPAMSLNSAPESGERIRVAAGGLICNSLHPLGNQRNSRPKTTPRFLAVMRFTSLCLDTLWRCIINSLAVERCSGGSLETNSDRALPLSVGSRIWDAWMKSSCKAYVRSGLGKERKYVLRTDVTLQISLNLSESRRLKES